MTERAKLTAMVICYNSEALIRPCLESLKWADELIVVDSFSTDSTVEIAREYADKVLQHAYEYYSAQRSWTIPHASHEWVLEIDTDERVTPELRAEIEELLVDPKGYSGFWIPRLNYYFGRPMKYHPDPQMRLFMRDKAHYDGRLAHPKVNIDGQVGYLRNKILHFGVRDVDQAMRTMMRYAKRDAEQRNHEGFKFRPWHLFTRPLRIFIYIYFFKLQILNGLEGFAGCLLKAWYYFLIYSNLWQMQKNSDSGIEQP